MKKKISFILLIILAGAVLICCVGKKDGGSTHEFNKTSNIKLQTEAKKYSEEELQNGEVPLNEYIQLSGEIIQSDSKTNKIEKGDRFILKSGSSKYQVFNEQPISLEVGEDVTVYGEYYGFIKGIVINKNEAN